MLTQEIILTSRMIRDDCDLLDQIQSSFPNLKIILSDDTTPYIHLYKNEDEAFTFDADHFKEELTEKDYENLLTFNVDEKIAVLINTINLYLIDKEYDETQPFILFYCGTYITKTKITTRLKLLQIL